MFDFSLYLRLPQKCNVLLKWLKVTLNSISHFFYQVKNLFFWSNTLVIVQCLLFPSEHQLQLLAKWFRWFWRRKYWCCSRNDARTWWRHWTESWPPRIPNITVERVFTYDVMALRILWRQYLSFFTKQRFCRGRKKNKLSNNALFRIIKDWITKVKKGNLLLKPS